jgi:hypothetical protein
MFLAGRQLDAPQEALYVLYIMLCKLPTSKQSWINDILFGVIFMWQSNIHCIFVFFLCSYCLVVSSNSINLGRCLQLGESLETWCGFYQSISPHTERFFFWILVAYHRSQVFRVIYLSVFTLGRRPRHFSCFLVIYLSILHLIHDQNNTSHILHSISQCLWV